MRPLVGELLPCFFQFRQFFEFALHGRDALRLVAHAPQAPVIGPLIPYVLAVIVLSIVAQTILALSSPKEANAPADERERAAIDLAGHWSGVVLGVLAIASCITAKLSGCLTAISIDRSARQPVVPLASSPSSARWMRRSGCLLTAMSAASGGAHSDLGTSADCAKAGRTHRKELRFFDEETLSLTGFR